MTTIEIQGAGAIKIGLQAGPGNVTKATVRALNRAINSGRTVMVREIAGDTGLKSKDVRDALSMQQATPWRMEASLGATIKRLLLMKFNAKGPRPSRGLGRGVTYRLKGGQGRVENAFIATMTSGHEGVFKRVGKARLGITELHGPSIGHVFKKFRPAGIERAIEVFTKNFDHEMEFVKGGADVGTD